MLHLNHFERLIAIYSCIAKYLLSTTIIASTRAYLVLLRKSVDVDRIIRNSIRAAERTLCAINRSNGTRSETIKPAVHSPEMYNENPDSPKSRSYEYEYSRN